MFELFKSELLRLRLPAMWALVLLLCTYYLLPRFGLWDVVHRNMGVFLTAGTLVLASVFGVVHALLWRHKNYWTFLIHRPLSPSRIYLSLSGAGVAVIFATVLLSLLITLTGYDLLSAKVVDTRHYTFAVYLTLVGIACYMVGTLAVLHRSKFAILVAYAALIAVFPQPQNGLAQYLPVLLLIGILFYLNRQCFKPDLSTQIASPVGLSLLATGTSFALVAVLIMATAVFYHLPRFVLGNHPDIEPPQGSMRLMWKDNFKDGVAYALAKSEHPQASHYAQQATLATRQNMPIFEWLSPRRGQQHRFDAGNALYDEESGTLWKFSHDEMLLVGVESFSGKAAGAIGMQGYVEQLDHASAADRFTQVPYLSGNRYLSVSSAFYAVDFATRTLQLKHQTDPGEHYTSGLWVNDASASIATNKRLLIFDASTLNDPYSELYVDYQIAFPTSLDHIEYAYGFQVADGFLVLLMGQNYFGFDQPGVEVFVARLDGSSDYLGGRKFEVYDHPAWIRHYNFMVAPVIEVVENLLMHAIDPGDSRHLSARELAAMHFPTNVYALAAVLQLLSLGGVIWLVRRHQLVKSHRVTWVSLGAILGLPALLSFLLLNPLKPDR